MPSKTYTTKYSPGDEVYFLHQFTIYKGIIVRINISDSHENHKSILYEDGINYMIQFELNCSFSTETRSENEVFDSREDLIMSIK